MEDYPALSCEGLCPDGDLAGGLPCTVAMGYDGRQEMSVQ